jgi:hypothetical protein
MDIDRPIRDFAALNLGYLGAKYGIHRAVINLSLEFVTK